MHPKNTTGHNWMQHKMLTTLTDYYHQDISADGVHSEPLLAVQSGQDCEKAINQAAMLLGSANEIMTLLTNQGMETNTIFGLRFLIESSMALMESTMSAVMEAKCVRSEQ